MERTDSLAGTAGCKSIETIVSAVNTTFVLVTPLNAAVMLAVPAAAIVAKPLALIVAVFLSLTQFTLEVISTFEPSE